MLLDIDGYSPSDEIKEQLAKRHFVAFVGPGAVGKDTVIDAATKLDDRFSKVISHTDRQPRRDEGETEGVDYFFFKDDEESVTELKKQILGRELVQIAAGGDNYYWSEPKQWSKSQFPMMDVWRNELKYGSVSKLKFAGRTVIMLAVHPDLWIPRFNERFPVGHEKREDRLHDAAHTLYEGINTNSSEVLWVPNNGIDSGRFAAEQTIKIALDRSGESQEEYRSNDYGREVAEEMLKAINIERGFSE